MNNAFEDAKAGLAVNAAALGLLSKELPTEGEHAAAAVGKAAARTQLGLLAFTLVAVEGVTQAVASNQSQRLELMSEACDSIRRHVNG